ncbi:MAG: M23 family metallopeptidase [Chitinophagales bacterium]|nr:M23 family metallopeptidase [Chitinophagales bacterium]
MAETIKTKPTKKLKNRFRFVVLNDDTFEEKFSLTLTRTNVWVFMSTVAVTLIFLTTAAIVYTPLKYFIPGFGDYNYRSDILRLQFQTDSLEQAMYGRQIWMENLMNIALGNVDTSLPSPDKPGNFDKASIKLNEVSETDKKLRKEVENEENYALRFGTAAGSAIVEEVKLMHMLAPVDGYVTESYDAQKEHYGIDIAVKENASVKAVLDGKVISATYTVETGYVITVQHRNNLVSFYKHNAKLLRKPGDMVKAGDVIAFAGNSGETSTGPHLHFELWHEGKSLNPKDYIVF